VHLVGFYYTNGNRILNRKTNPRPSEQEPVCEIWEPQGSDCEEY